jgi:hypothetical protein
MKNPFANEPVTFSLRLPADLATKLDEMAEEQKRSRSNLIRSILAQAVEPRNVVDHLPSTDPLAQGHHYTRRSGGRL